MKFTKITLTQVLICLCCGCTLIKTTSPLSSESGTQSLSAGAISDRIPIDQQGSPNHQINNYQNRISNQINNDQKRPGDRTSPFHLPEAPLTLSQACDIALANNPEVLAAVLDSRAAKANSAAVAAERWPGMRAVGGYSRYLDEQRLVPSRGSNDPGVFSKDMVIGDLTLKMPLFTAGRISAETRAAEFMWQSADHRLNRIRQELIFNVSNIFFSIIGQKKVIESLEFSTKTMKEHQQRINDLIKAKKAAGVDLLRTEVRLADLEQRLVSERNLLAVQHRILANLLGVRETGKQISIQGELKLGEEEKTDLEPDLSQAMAKALDSRPDYLAEAANLETQASRLEAQRSSQWPEVSIKASYGGRYAAGASSQPTGSEDFEDVGSAGLWLDMPVFEGGRILARLRQQLAKLEADRERFRKTELQISLEVETAILKIVSNRQRVETTQKVIEHAKESLRIEQEKYELSKGSITDVLDAQSALLDAQTNYYRSLVEYHTSLAQLRLATGTITQQ